MLRLFLPPNLPAAAQRDAIPVKVELDLSQAPPPEWLPALALLQSWSQSPAPPPFLQLKRTQLRQLVGALQGKPAFWWVNQPSQPILWIGPHLRGVTEHLESAEKPPVSAPAPVGRPTQPAARPATHSSVTPFVVDGSEHFLSISLPSREQVGYAAALDLVKSNGFVLEPSNRKWWLRDRHKVLNFLARHRQRLEKEFHAEFTPNFQKNTARLSFAEISAEASPEADGFTLSLGLRAGRVAEDQLLAAAAANRGYVEDQDRIYLLDPERVQKLATAQRALAGDAGAGVVTRRTHRLNAARLAEADAVLEEIVPGFQPPAEWRTRSEALRNLSKLLPAPVPPEVDTFLRPYQRIGVAWLWHLFQNRLGGILADEMGLGKTLQALALLSCIQENPTSSSRHSASARARPALVVCPASLVENWRRECLRFAPQLRVLVHHGANRLPASLEEERYDVVVSSYGTVARDREILGSLEFSALIADEAQHLKNRRTQNAQALRAIRAAGRFCLTGTPLENSLDDLRSLFEILMPGLIEPLPTGLRGDERKWYDDRLRAKTANYILRRTKESVAPELPKKIEQVIFCEMSASQQTLYRQVQENSERALLDLEATGAKENSLRMAALTQLLRLRQVCCDPRLVAQAIDPGTGRPLADASSEAADSAKLEAFRELLSEAVDDGHRLLVFSQFTSLLALLRQELEAQEISYCYLDGSMSPRDRQNEVDHFQNDPTVPVFLLSLKAGGTGLNLTGADTVVHFDPWWNPAVEAQATDRAHRIGQNRVVTSYKLICTGSVEEKVLQLQATKRELLKDVFEASDAASAKISLADLRGLLR